MVKAIKQGADTSALCTHPVTVLVVLYFLHYTLVFHTLSQFLLYFTLCTTLLFTNVLFLTSIFHWCSWLNFEREVFLDVPITMEFCCGHPVFLHSTLEMINVIHKIKLFAHICIYVSYSWPNARPNWQTFF